MTNEWKLMDDYAKRPYVKLSDIDKERYEREMAGYKKNIYLEDRQTYKKDPPPTVAIKPVVKALKSK